MKTNMINVYREYTMINIANSESNTDCLVGTSTGRKHYEKRNRV